jgi:hypothetical protein
MVAVAGSGIDSMADHGEPRNQRPRSRNPLGRVWLNQRPKAWYWAAAFVVVVLLILLVLFVVNPEPSPGQ